MYTYVLHMCIHTHNIYIYTYIYTSTYIYRNTFPPFTGARRGGGKNRLLPVSPCRRSMLLWGVDHCHPCHPVHHSTAPNVMANSLALSLLLPPSFSRSVSLYIYIHIYVCPHFQSLPCVPRPARTTYFPYSLPDPQNRRRTLAQNSRGLIYLHQPPIYLLIKGGTRKIHTYTFTDIYKELTNMMVLVVEGKDDTLAAILNSASMNTLWPTRETA